MSFNSFENYPLAWKPDKSKLQPPYYLSLAEDLEQQITSGFLQPGTKLPPQRELADFLELNYTTITRVYNLCKEKGLVYGRAGSGTFVANYKERDTTISFPMEQTAIEMGGITCFSENTELVEQATRSVLQKSYLGTLYDYSYPLGQPHQLAAAVRWLEMLNVHCDISQLAITTGTQNALTIALMALFEPGAALAVEEYTYANFIELAKILHLVLVPVAGDAQGMLPDALERQCRLQKISGIYLMPSCSNPSTVAMPQKRREELAQTIESNQLILIEDDISGWLYAATGEPQPSSFFDLLGGQSVYVCGMTKSLCAGLRIAYMVFGDNVRDRILHCRDNTNLKTSGLDAEIITELLLSGVAQKIIRRKLALTRKACALYAKYFPASAIAGASALSYYKWLSLPERKSMSEVEDELYKLGVHVYHSSRFAVTPVPKQDFLRLSLCSAGDLRRLEQGLRIIKNYIGQ